MYASLDTIDVQLAAQHGRARVIQTDFRDQSDMLTDRHLSVVFALIRCVNPLRSREPFSVIYNCRTEPPGFLRDAVGAAGAELWVGDDPSFLAHPRTPSAVNIPAVDKLFGDGMRELALAASARLADPLEALIQAEGVIKTSGAPTPSDEAAFWSAVVGLAAMAGEALRISADAVWRYNPKALATLPFTCDCLFEGDRATVNPLGKALKFIRAPSDGEEPSALVKAVLASPS
jgi:hypothetical protein